MHGRQGAISHKERMFGSHPMPPCERPPIADRTRSRFTVLPMRAHRITNRHMVSGRTFHDNGAFVGPWIKMLEAEVAKK